jgi:hypothetical protein
MLFSRAIQFLSCESEITLLLLLLLLHFSCQNDVFFKMWRLKIIKPFKSVLSAVIVSIVLNI